MTDHVFTTSDQDRTLDELIARPDVGRLAVYPHPIPGLGTYVVEVYAASVDPAHLMHQWGMVAGARGLDPLTPPGPCIYCGCAYFQRPRRAACPQRPAVPGRITAIYRLHPDGSLEPPITTNERSTDA